MTQVRSIKDEFTMFETTGVSPRQSLAAICTSGLWLVLERLHLCSAPVIISAECIQDGAAKGNTQG